MVKKGNENYSSKARNSEKQAFVKKLLYYVLRTKLSEENLSNEAVFEKFSSHLPIITNSSINSGQDELNKPAEEYRIITIEEYARIIKKRFTDVTQDGEYTIVNAFTKDILHIDTEGVVYERYLQKTRENYPELYYTDENDQLKLVDLSEPELLKDEDFFDAVFCRYNDILEIYESIEDEYIKNRIATSFLDEVDKLKKFMEDKERYEAEITQNKKILSYSKSRIKHIQPSFYKDDDKDREF